MLRESKVRMFAVLALGALGGYLAASGRLLPHPRAEAAPQDAKVQAKAPAQPPVTPGSPSATTTVDGKYLPNPPAKFGGTINLSAKDSKPWWPPQVVPPKGAPNVLLIMTDDQGYGVCGTFGGVIPTPNMDRIAKMGLRYTHFHSTALCSPTRAAIITGRNHHSVGFGVISEQATGYPGYNSIIGVDNGTIGEILKQNGYATSWFGKNHNTPDYQYSAAGPFTQWPDRHGLRVLLRVHGRRDRPVDAVPLPQHHADLPVPRRPRLQPDHRHGRRRDRPSEAAQRGRARQAVLLLLRARRAPMRPTIRRRNGATSSRASSTWAGTPCASRSSRTRRSSV